MENEFLIDSIINKIKFLDNYTVEFLEKNIKILTPAGKYQAYLVTSAIVINRLKAINTFRSNNINIDLFLDKLLNEAIEKFEEYKVIHDKVSNTFTHSSAVISAYLNRGNRNCFSINQSNLKHNSYVMIGIYNLELEKELNFSQIYINLFAYPFFNTDLPIEEQDSYKKSILSYINAHDFTELQYFNSQMVYLINYISTKLNEDSLFITKTSKTSPHSGSNKQCYIATLVYQDIEHPRVVLLRNYRDTVLVNTIFGKQFIKFYYATSPRLVAILKPYSLPQRIIKKILNILTNKLIKK